MRPFDVWTAHVHSCASLGREHAIVDEKAEAQNQAFINNSYVKSDVLIKGCSGAEGSSLN